MGLHCGNVTEDEVEEVGMLEVLNQNQPSEVEGMVEDRNQDQPGRVEEMAEGQNQDQPDKVEERQVQNQDRPNVSASSVASEDNVLSPVGVGPMGQEGIENGEELNPCRSLRSGLPEREFHGAEELAMISQTATGQAPNNPSMSHEQSIGNYIRPGDQMALNVSLQRELATSTSETPEFVLARHPSTSVAGGTCGADSQSSGSPQGFDVQRENGIQQEHWNAEQIMALLFPNNQNMDQDNSPGVQDYIRSIIDEPDEEQEIINIRGPFWDY